MVKYVYLLNQNEFVWDIFCYPEGIIVLSFEKRDRIKKTWNSEQTFSKHVMNYFHIYIYENNTYWNGFILKHNKPPPLKPVWIQEMSKGVLAPLGSYMHLEMCQSLMLTAKATVGQRSAPGGIGQILHNEK